MLGYHKYLIRGVSKDEWGCLKEKIEKFDFEANPSIRYEPEGQCIGLWFKIKDKESLILDSEDFENLDDKDRTQVISAYSWLENQLEEIRLRDGKNWVD